MEDVKAKRGVDGSIDNDGPIGPGHEPQGHSTNPQIHKKALLKLDLILLSTVTLIYFLNFLDR